ncbi:guanine deaminase [Vagococcus penaei]|uniref:Guanine deaminase n=2 Tax=Vagococcus penaei TaxID=633807 RepID=A0A1Q2D8P8_9ENTE|nr:guanine deaminase [Vagococcus penaei]RSU01029.1 guanine deaminase [Vagococcus penaei]
MVNSLVDVLFCINEEGIIEKIISPEEPNYQQVLVAAKSDGILKELASSEYLLPGFIDLHVHAPQWPQAGLALDRPLHDWLNTYTFPLEAKYADVEFAEKVYSHLVDRLLSLGTTTALYFATVHKEASVVLAKTCATKGQRGLVGKVVMDHPNENPSYYRDASTEQALSDTEAFIQEVQELNQTTKQGVYPVVTPRFIPSCTDEALQGLGQLAEKYDTHIQSHCSESDWEHQYAYNRYGKSDTEMLHSFGLLTDKSVMAHAGLLSDADMQQFADTGAAVAHCPISNAYFGNAVTRVKQLMDDYQVKVGLGSDISGGFSPSLYDNLKQAVISSRMLEDGVNPLLSAEQRGKAESRLSLNEVFYLATVGGGEALSLPIGKLDVGYAFDAQIIDVTRFPFIEETDLDEVFQKSLYLTESEDIKQVFVQGELVYSNKGAK